MKTQVKLRLENTSQPVEYLADGTYEKGSFYCIRTGDTVVKVPIANIFQVVETYGYHTPKGAPDLERDAPLAAEDFIERVDRNVATAAEAEALVF